MLLFTLHCQLNVPVCRAKRKTPYNGFYLILSIIYFILETVLLQNVSSIYDVTFMNSSPLPSFGTVAFTLQRTVPEYT